MLLGVLLKLCVLQQRSGGNHISDPKSKATFFPYSQAPKNQSQTQHQAKTAGLTQAEQHTEVEDLEQAGDAMAALLRQPLCLGTINETLLRAH